MTSITSNTIFAQTVPVECHVAGAGTPDLNYFGLGVDRSQTEYWVKVYFHIVRKDDGSGGYDASRLPILENILNNAFNPHKIYFDYVCSVSYFDDSERVANGALTIPLDWCEWESIDMPSDGINIFIIANNSGIQSSALGIASGIPGTFMVLASAAVATFNTDIESTTIIHEMGHLLGLLHMFHGCTQNPLIWHEGQCDPACLFSEAFINCEDYNNPIVNELECAETISNRHICGDYIPDTAPSHFLIEAEVVGCEWDPNTEVPNVAAGKPWPIIKDPDGQNYNPDVTNFMSLIPTKSCRNYFTPNQVTVMKNHLEDHPVLEDVLTSPPAISCECPYQNVISISGTATNWSTVVQANSLPATSLSDYEIRVEGNLNIDIDYNFNDCMFIFAENDQLIINNNRFVKFGGTKLTSCDEKWQGITLSNNSDVRFTECEIKNAITGISSVVSSTLSLYDNSFIMCNTGIYISGEMNIRYFDKNLFLSGEIGVHVVNCNSYLQLKASSFEDTNTFSYIGTGIVLMKSSAQIQNNEFHFNLNGISLEESIGTNILNNKIGYRLSGISVKKSSEISIRNNELGSNHQLYGYGIEFTSVVFSRIENNNIRTTNLGIRLFDCLIIRISSNDIHVSSKTLDNSGGISINSSKLTFVLNNEDIDVVNGIFGIESNFSELDSIEGNIVNLIPQDWLISAAGIRLNGSDRSTIYRNEISASGLFTSGISLVNATINTIDCNASSSMNALRIGDNSFPQRIKTNILKGFLYDLQIRSEIGIQNHRGNEFLIGNTYAIGLDDDELNNSRFLVDDTYPYHMPSHPIPGNDEWFTTETGFPSECSSPPDPPMEEIYADTVMVCDYWSRLRDVKDENLALFHIRMLDLLYIYRVSLDFHLPNCISSDSIFNQSCNLVVTIQLSKDKIAI